LGGYRPTVPAGDFVFGVVNQKRKPRGVGAGVDIFLTSENIERLQPLAICPFLWNFPEFSLPHNLRAPVLERKLCRKAFVGGIDVDSDNGRLAFGDSGNEGVELGWVKRTNASKNASVTLARSLLCASINETKMTEDRKHAILFAATLLCARKMIEIMDSDKPNFAKQYFVDKAVDEAAFILERIDRKWPITNA